MAYFNTPNSNVCPQGAIGLHTCAQHYHSVPLIMPNPDDEPDLPEHREDERRIGNPLFDPQPFEHDSFGVQELRVDSWGAPTPRWTQQERMLREWCLFYGNKVLAPHEATITTPWYLTAQYIAKRLQSTHEEAMTIAACLKILDLPQQEISELLTWISQVQDIPFATSYLETWATQAAFAEYTDPEDAMEHRSFNSNPHIDNLPDDNTELNSEEIIIPDDQQDDTIDDVQELDPDWTPLDQWLEGSLDEAQGLDFAYPTEAWHILDEQNEPDWESLQPPAYIVILNQTRFAKTLQDLRPLSQHAYTITTWTSQQRSVFWDAYTARKNALNTQLLRIKNVRAAINKISRLPVQDLSITTAKLLHFTRANPDFYPKDALTFIWDQLNQRRATVTT